MSNNVHVWEENVTIPTYKVYPPEKGLSLSRTVPIREVPARSTRFR